MSTSNYDLPENEIGTSFSGRLRHSYEELTRIKLSYCNQHKQKSINPHMSTKFPDRAVVYPTDAIFILSTNMMSVPLTSLAGPSPMRS